MGSRSQRKGRKGELELTGILNEHGIPARPGAPASYGRTPDVVGVPGLHVEVKRAERLNLPAAMLQAVQDAVKFGGLPAVFHRRNRTPWLVTMRLEDYLLLYSKWKEEV